MAGGVKGLALWAHRSGNGSAAAPHAFAKLLPLLRSHVLPTLSHTVLPFPTPAAVAMEAAKENLAKDKEAKRLPEGDRMPTENSGNQGIPQTLDNEAEDHNRNHGNQQNLNRFCDFM